jgi:hypothetical protein
MMMMKTRIKIKRKLLVQGNEHGKARALARMVLLIKQKLEQEPKGLDHRLKFFIHLVARQKNLISFLERLVLVLRKMGKKKKEGCWKKDWRRRKVMLGEASLQGQLRRG